MTVLALNCWSTCKFGSLGYRMERHCGQTTVRVCSKPRICMAAPQFGQLSPLTVDPGIRVAEEAGVIPSPRTRADFSASAHRTPRPRPGTAAAVGRYSRWWRTGHRRCEDPRTAHRIYPNRQMAARLLRLDSARE